MSMMERLRDFLERDDNDDVKMPEDQLNIEEPTNTEDDEQEPDENRDKTQVIYYQWYEIDPVRWHKEEQAMQRKNFQARVYQDGRIVFVGKVMDIDVLVFLDYFYPLKPPTVYILSEKQLLPKDFVNEDGSIDLFRRERYWDANKMTVSTVIDWLEEMFSILDSLQQDK